jgi:hypothetical protein
MLIYSVNDFKNGKPWSVPDFVTKTYGRKDIMMQWEERYGIILASQTDANPSSYPVADENKSFDVLDKVSTLMQLVKCHYDREIYQATLCDPGPDFRTYEMVGGFGTEAGAIYRLTEKP